MKNRERRLKLARAQASLMSRIHHIAYIHEFSNEFKVSINMHKEYVIHTYKNGSEIANPIK